MSGGVNDDDESRWSLILPEMIGQEMGRWAWIASRISVYTSSMDLSEFTCRSGSHPLCRYMYQDAAHGRLLFIHANIFYGRFRTYLNHFLLLFIVFNHRHGGFDESSCVNIYARF
jgi:hypothetical protein